MVTNGGSHSPSGTPIYAKALYDELTAALLPIMEKREAQAAVTLLLEHFCGLTRTALTGGALCVCTEDAAQKAREAAKRLQSGVPLAYLTGEQYFWNDRFEVGTGVLIPRQDTETLVEQTLALLHSSKAPAVSASFTPPTSPVVLDLCAGSGCVGASVAGERPDVQVIGVEKEDKAFFWLKKNHRTLCRPNWQIVQADCLTDPTRWLLPLASGGVSVVAANPPYIPAAVLPSLDAPVQAEPETALNGGTDGLDFYRQLPHVFAPYLHKGGFFCFEIGYDQGESVPALWCQMGLANVRLFADDCGNSRVVIGQMPEGGRLLSCF